MFQATIGVLGKLSCVALLALLLMGCRAEEGDLTTSSVAQSDKLYHEGPPPDDLTKARRHFHAGEYGLAERHFRAAIEDYAQDVGAWVGLAATYDQLRRFDLAERAYNRAMALHGRSALLLNNLGYHYYLRGQNKRAAQVLADAARLDPNNPKIQANIELVKSGPKRAALASAK